MNQNLKNNSFRVKGERFALFWGVTLFIIFGVIFSSINFPLFVFLLIIGLVQVKIEQARHLGNSIRVHNTQFPEIYNIFREYAESLGIEKANIYITQDPYLNAFTLGFNTCTVVLHSSLVEQLSFDELKFVIAHELAHFKLGHTKISSFINPLGQGNFFSNFFFGFWNRKAEYSCDRCGVILTKNIDCSISSMLKLSLGGKLFRQFKIEGYLPQLKKSESNLVKASELFMGHPTITNRLRSIIGYWNKISN